MKKNFAAAIARLNARLQHLTPVQIWITGAIDAALTMLVTGLIVAAILAGVQ